MECPCVCDECGEVVELYDMKKSNYGKHMSCVECHNKENQENCDHDWEHYEGFKVCTYPECGKEESTD